MKRLYRPNVAGLFVNAEGLLLICERMNNKEAWQFPQGGIEEGESAEAALGREMEEEVGYDRDEYEVVRSKGGYRYDYPDSALAFVREKRGVSYVGQEQTYFLCRLKDGAGEPFLDGREFSRFKWIAPEEFRLSWLPPFKQEVYAAVMKDFFEVDLVG